MNEHLNERDPQLIEEVSNLLHLAPAIVEKDLYVTQVLHTLASVEDEFYQLVFQGGTCLAKAHQIIERMSEDCDFRMVAKFLPHALSKEKSRQKLRAFRQQTIEKLKLAGFAIPTSQIRARNEGQYMDIYLDYTSAFPSSEALRPQIQLEFIAIETKLPAEIKPISSLMKQLLKDQIKQDAKSIPCVAIIETAADKWVAFTRRVATIARSYREHDPTLIRHLYDLHILDQKGLITAQFYSLIDSTMQSDIAQYHSHNPEYTADPKNEIKFALTELENNAKWRKNWEQFVAAMVFRQGASTYQQALDSLKKISSHIL